MKRRREIYFVPSYLVVQPAHEQKQQRGCRLSWNLDSSTRTLCLTGTLERPQRERHNRRYSVFDDEELYRLKAELDTKRGLVQGAVVHKPATGKMNIDGADATSESRAIVRGSTSELPQTTPHEFIDQLADAILARQATKKKQEPPISDLAAKLLSTRTEARR